ncbi:M48 family metalloprotease [Halomicrobium sp. HM KBTZ05]|uniref:M48 family metalloprotease n=1 Tax=Halomicrobium sp. HM KBTZ05 TaxID=3242663 RepID=UPI00355714B3
MTSRVDLRRRMAGTLVALLAGNVAFVVVLTVLFEPWLAPVRAVVLGAIGVGGAAAETLWWVVVTALLLCGFLWAQLRYTRRRTLAEVDARTVDREAYPDLHARVDRLAQLANCPPPTVAVADSSVPNSFAVGTVRSATIVVSDGLLATLDGDELDAVLAHELAHVANHDATVMTLASFLPALTNGEYRPLADTVGPVGRRAVLAGGALVAGTALSSAVGSPSRTGVERLVAVLVLAGGTYLLAGIALGVLTAPVAYLARSLSRDREFAADRGAVQLTGEPATLASALERVDDSVASSPETDKRRAYEGVRGLCFLPHGFERDADRSPLYIETRSHPPTEARIEHLQSLSV